MIKWPFRVRLEKDRNSVQSEEPNQGIYGGAGKCCEFNVYVGGTKEDRGSKLAGVEKVVLPKMERGQDGQSTAMTMRVEFYTLENAVTLLKRAGEWKRIEVRAAVTYLNVGVGYGFHGHQYIMDAFLTRLEQSPIERNKGTAVSATFSVRAYTVYVDDEKMLEIKAEEKHQ